MAGNLQNAPRFVRRCDCDIGEQEGIVLVYAFGHSRYSLSEDAGLWARRKVEHYHRLNVDQLEHLDAKSLRQSEQPDRKRGETDEETGNSPAANQ